MVKVGVVTYILKNLTFVCNRLCAASGNDVAKTLSKLEKERQRKERQKERKLVELESALQNALNDLSEKGLRWVIHLKNKLTQTQLLFNNQYIK